MSMWSYYIDQTSRQARDDCLRGIRQSPRDRLRWWGWILLAALVLMPVVVAVLWT